MRIKILQGIIEVLNIIARGGTSIMQEFDRVTEYLRDYLSQNHYCHSLISANERCFRELKCFLERKGADYSPSDADAWLSEYFPRVAKNDRSHFNIAILRLRDIYDYGYILPEHDTRHHRSYSILSDDWKGILDNYLTEIGKNLAPKTVACHKYQCARFLIFAQRQGASNPGEITFDILISFYDEHRPRTSNGKNQSDAKVASMLNHFYSRGLVPYSFTIIIHYLAVGKKQGCYWNEVSKDAHAKIAELSAKHETVDAEVLIRYKEAVVTLHRQNDYSKTMTSAYNRAADLLIMFLEMNGYRYSPAIARIWFLETQSCFGTEVGTIKRSLCLIADYHETSEIHIEKMYRNKASAFESLPEWCCGAAHSYVETKIKEGWERSTLDMIRSSVGRFCFYLDSIGIRSFMELDASHIKRFQIDDIHKTPQGKNAYNVRIRKFLLYLGSEGMLINPMLFVSLPHTSAPKETIVVVLTEEEMTALNGCLENDAGPLTLRDKAMLLLGLKMGIRGSDIANLKIEDVNWDEASIRFIQKKTSVEVNLPMPPAVGNALFRYIMEERHPKESPDIFLSERAPYRSVSRQVCKKAIDAALPDRKVDGSGFHVTRKTFATNLLKSGIGVGVVAEALGQRDTSSVHRYLSLDADRMRMCPISMSHFGIRGWDYAS